MAPRGVGTLVGEQCLPLGTVQAAQHRRGDDDPVRAARQGVGVGSGRVDHAQVTGDGPARGLRTGRPEGTGLAQDRADEAHAAPGQRAGRGDGGRDDEGVGGGAQRVDQFAERGEERQLQQPGQDGRAECQRRAAGEEHRAAGDGPQRRDRGQPVQGPAGQGRQDERQQQRQEQQERGGHRPSDSSRSRRMRSSSGLSWATNRARTVSRSLSRSSSLCIRRAVRPWASWTSCAGK